MMTMKIYLNLIINKQIMKINNVEMKNYKKEIL